MKISPMPRRLTRSSRIASTCSCTVTSSAEVGSSAISRSGSRDQHHGDHHALAHAAGELVRTGAHRRARIADAHRRQHVQAASRACALGTPLCARDRPRRSGRPMVITGLSENFGSCITMEMRLPRIARISPAAGPSRSVPSKASLRAVTSPGEGTRPQDRRGRSWTCPSRIRRRCRASRGRHGEADAAHRMDHARRRVEADVQLLDVEAWGPPVVHRCLPSDRARRAARRRAG